MLFVIFIILLVIGILIDNNAIKIGSCVFIAISLVIIISNQISWHCGLIEKNEMRYENLTTRYENILKKTGGATHIARNSIEREIQDWNEDLCAYKNKQRNFWVGVYYPNVFDDFEYIELKGE